MNITNDFNEWCKNSSDSVYIDSVNITYIQEPDCTENAESDEQSLTISTRNGGGGNFYHIKTEGWSFDSPEELLNVINNFIDKTK